MIVSINPTANTMTVTTTSNANDLVTIDINLLTVLPPTGILNCNFYYPVVNVKMIFLTDLIPPTLTEVRFDPLKSSFAVSYLYQLPLFTLSSTNPLYASIPGL